MSTEYCNLFNNLEILYYAFVFNNKRYVKFTHHNLLLSELYCLKEKLFFFSKFINKLFLVLYIVFNFLVFLYFLLWCSFIPNKFLKLFFKYFYVSIGVFISYHVYIPIYIFRTIHYYIDGINWLRMSFFIKYFFYRISCVLFVEWWTYTWLNIFFVEFCILICVFNTWYGKCLQFLDILNRSEYTWLNMN